MSRIHRLSLLFSVVLAAGVAGSGMAQGAELLHVPTTVLDGTLTAAPGTYEAAAISRSVPAVGRGHPQRGRRRPGQGDGRARRRQGDWDVAVFDAAGRAIAADASPDAQEVAVGYASAAGTLRVQACRRSGDAASVPATLEHAALRDGALELAKRNAPKLVSVITPTRAHKDQLLALGLDMTEHGGSESLGVVLHGPDDEAALRKAGCAGACWSTTWSRRATGSGPPRAARRAAAASVLPSGRTTYRTLADYNTELKELADANPGLVRLFTLPNKTWLGKDVMGIEITTNVNANDGKPAFLNMGVHHAREWPSGEHAMEWAYELINGFKAGNPRATKIVREQPQHRRPDRQPGRLRGVAQRRPARPTRAATRPSTTRPTSSAGPRPGASTGARTAAFRTTPKPATARRRRDWPRTAWTRTATTAACGAARARTRNPLVQTYRGPGPFSEPETRNIQSLVSRNQVVTLITNHTTAGLVLRAPGLAALGDPVDENRGYKALGDAMAKHNGYFSQKGFELYDTTGTTEDWSYNTAGGFGFTFEIYCGAPNYDTGDCDDPAFHPLYETMVKEWTGENPQADHETDPGPGRRLRRPGQPRGVLHRRREHAQRGATQRARGQRPRRGHGCA